jgi:hypothetical protein
VGTNNHQNGSYEIPVGVVYNGMIAQVSFMMWYPKFVSVNSSDITLNTIDTTSGEFTSSKYRRLFENDAELIASIDEQEAIHEERRRSMLSFDSVNGALSNCTRFQKAYLSAYAHFHRGIDGEYKWGDVTDMVEFVSSNKTIITVNGTEIQGQSLGYSDITITYHSPETYVARSSSRVTVVADYIGMDALNVVVYSNATWLDYHAQNEFALNESLTPEFQFTREMEAYGRYGYIQVYAEYHDGTWEDVTDEAQLSLLAGFEKTLQMGDDNSFRVTDISEISWCKPAIYASFAPCNNTNTFSSIGFVEKQTPQMVSCKLTIDEEQIAPIGDGATLPPFNITDIARVTVTVFYDDGSARDFTYHNNTVLTIIQGDDLVELDGNRLTVLPTAIIEPNLNWDVTIQVTFPGLYDCSDVANTSVVEFEYLNLTAVNYPSVLGLESISELRQIHCSGIYQRAELMAVGVLTDGTTKGGVSFSRWVNFTSSDDSLGTFTVAPCFQGRCRGLATAAAGSLIVQGKFGGVAAHLMINILGESVTITHVEALPTIGDFDTLHGLVNTTDNLEVYVNFSDGTSFIISESGSETSDWLRPSTLLLFEAGHPNIVSVNEEGIVTLHGNYYTGVEVTVSDRCANKYSDKLYFYANLDPDEHDVDLGHLYGPSLGQVTVGDYFDVQVRIQASDIQPLVAFQIKLTFDYDELHVESDDYCGRLNGWGWNFECTSNDPEYELLMVGTCGLVNAADCGTFNNNVISNVTFRAVQAGFIHMTGVIIKIMGNETVTTKIDLFAGDAYFYVIDPLDSETDEDRQTYADEIYASAEDHPNNANDDRKIRSTERSPTRRNFSALGNSPPRPSRSFPKSESSSPNSSETAAAAAQNYTNATNATNITSSAIVVKPDNCDTMQGDIDGDCVCDVADVLLIQLYIGGQTDMSNLTSRAIYSLDANLDGIVDSADVHFLLRIVAYKFRFLADYSTTPYPFTLAISMLTWQSLPSHQNQSSLWMELALDLNKALNMSFDYGNISSTKDGVFIIPEVFGVGKFGAGGLANIDEYNVPLVIIVETYDVWNRTSDSRLSPFYCTRRIEFCRDAFGDSEDAFIPFKYPNLTIPERTSYPTAAPNFVGENISAARSASANLFTIMAVAGALIAALTARHFYKKAPTAKGQPFQQFAPEAPVVGNEGFAAGVFKKWKPAPPPPIRMKTTEYITDLQEPGILEKGIGGDESRRLTGEVLPGLYDQTAQPDLADVSDFLALKDPNIVIGSAKFGGREPPKLRMDRVNSWESDDADAPPPDVFSAPPPAPHDHSSTISQMPPKVPGGPKLRLERLAFSDDEDDDATDWVPPRLDHGGAISQLPPKSPGGPQVRIDRNSENPASDDDDDAGSDVSDLSE